MLAGGGRGEVTDEEEEEAEEEEVDAVELAVETTDAVDKDVVTSVPEGSLPAEAERTLAPDAKNESIAVAERCGGCGTCGCAGALCARSGSRSCFSTCFSRANSLARASCSRLTCAAEHLIEDKRLSHSAESRARVASDSTTARCSCSGAKSVVVSAGGVGCKLKTCSDETLLNESRHSDSLRSLTTTNSMRLPSDSRRGTPATR